ncbi:MAG: S-layer homology domain-containing protein, partial [Defluviitaleaceae bacterium]|nr:S-layer homology domain-containing protein [Defluviitaleaceae bacterium]
MNRRFLAMLLSVVMMLSLLPTAVYAADYSGHWAESSIGRAIEMGWFARNDAGIYRPNDSITRAEFVTMVNRLQGNTELADLSEFSDVSPGAWYYEAFQKAVAAGFVTGNEGRLYPTNNITRNEAVAIFARISGIDTANTVIPAGVRDAGAVPEWARPFVAGAIRNGLITGSDGNFNGANNITRAETAVLLERLHDDLRVFAFAGEYNIARAANVMLAAADVILKNTVVSGNVTVTPAVGEGDVTLDHVTVNGRLIVQGGGMDSVIIINSTIGEIVITKDEVRVVLQDGSSITSINSQSEGGSIYIEDGASVGTITVAAGAADSSVVIAEGATVGNVAVDAERVTVVIEGGATVTGDVVVTGDDSSVELE